MTYMELLGTEAKKAAKIFATYTAIQKNKALLAIANGLTAHTQEIIAANGQDLANAEAAGMTKSLQDRLRLTKERIADIADSVKQLTLLTDPIGEHVRGYALPNGLQVSQIRVPLGVVGMIFEARPNVTVDAAAICIKTGNAVILRGGKEAIHSNTALTKIMKSALYHEGFASNIIQLVEDTSREVANEMMCLNGYLDVLIPRGGAGLIQAVKKNATVPVIETGAGVCHVFVDSSADFTMAAEIINNGKTQRPSVCNAVECALIHKEIAKDFLPVLKEILDKSNVEIFGCLETKAILGDCVQEATDEHYATEYSDYKISIKIVENTEEAIAHIDRFSTHHSDCIVTECLAHAQQFTAQVDSACVYVNASTRFTDGGEFGFGAEIGISTQKLHARGPMGLQEMTSTKYVIMGNGQIR